jgi:hypothetical protein
VDFEKLTKSEVGHFYPFHFTEERQLSAGGNHRRFVAQQMVELIEEGLLFGGQSELKVRIIVNVTLVAIFFVELQSHFEYSFPDFLLIESNQTSSVQFTAVQLKNILFFFYSYFN